MQAMIEGKVLVYQDAGRGPAVVFVAETPAAAKRFSTQVEALVSRGFRIVTLDARAFDAPSGNSAGESERLVKLLDYLGIGRAAAIWTGRGEAVVRDLISRHPSRVATLLPADAATLFEEFSGGVGGVFFPGEMQRAAV